MVYWEDPFSNNQFPSALMSGLPRAFGWVTWPPEHAHSLTHANASGPAVGAAIVSEGRHSPPILPFLHKGNVLIIVCRSLSRHSY